MFLLESLVYRPNARYGKHITVLPQVYMSMMPPAFSDMHLSPLPVSDFGAESWSLGFIRLWKIVTLFFDDIPGVWPSKVVHTCKFDCVLHACQHS